MTHGRKRARGTFAATVLLAASLAAAPAIAKKPPPPPPPPVEDPDPWLGCTPWGSYIYDVDCCDYPDLVIPCEGAASDPAARPEDSPAEYLER
ncbi:MAG: hypothetical protein WBR13_08795 [Allosphingosinicella sp.]